MTPARSPPSQALDRTQLVRRRGELEVEVLAREQAAGPAEAARDFIGDEQRPVTAAQVAYPPDGVFLWNQDAEIDAAAMATLSFVGSARSSS